MAFWFLLLLGSLTYFMMQQSVARATRTPVWLLWLVLMTPAFVLTAWTLIYGAKQAPPSALILWVSGGCLLLYWVLFNRGRQLPVNPENQSPENLSPSNDPPPVETAPVRPIDLAEESQLRNCFPWSVYYVQNIEYRPQAVICRGQLRTMASAAYEQIKANIEGQFGDRFLVIFQEGMNDKPFFVLVPNPQTVKQNHQQEQDSGKISEPVLALLLLVATLFSTTFIGSKIAGFNLTQLESDFTLFLQGLPYALGLITILGTHELGHYLTAKFYKIRTTLPYFIPIPFFLGTFGAFIKIQSPIPHRKALFDVSIAGPLAGFIMTIPLLVWGLAHSEIVALPEKAGLLNPNALNPKYSILLALLSKLALGSELTAKSAIDLHPVAVAGFLGLIVTALNLMPVGQLDGGHIVHAMFGQRTAVIIGQVARLLLLMLSFIREEFLFWAIILLFVPLVDEPALNDVTELDNQRDFMGLMSMALLLLIVLPLPKFLANLLQI
ncbi:MAG: site-2 protease family protein [Aphanizomenon gracile PMC638.10]|nr:site-2 protease family protein [Aphanizomenon gracile PMC638.10]